MKNTPAFVIKRLLSKYYARFDKNNDFLRMYAARLRRYDRIDFSENLEKYADVLDMFEDEYSREAYERELYFHFLPLILKDRSYAGPCTPLMWRRAQDKAAAMLVEGSVPILFAPTEESLLTSITTCFVMNQYEYTPHVTVEQGDVFIDAGGFVGDTAIWAHSKGAGEIHSFEPNPENAALYEANKERYGSPAMHCHRFGVSGEDGEALFSSRSEQGAAGSHLVQGNERNAESIQVISLDSWCARERVVPNFIKMDIEGAEEDALHGARETITRHRPKLAISLYHNTAHLTTIPKLLRELCPDYRFWCKKVHPRYEFILFAKV